MIQGHLMPIRDMDCGYEREHYLEDPEDVLDRDFGVPQVNIHGDKQIYTWSNREREWYNAERRFIFACKSHEQRQLWINRIQSAVQDYGGQASPKATITHPEIVIENVTGERITSPDLNNSEHQIKDASWRIERVDQSSFISQTGSSHRQVN